MAKPDANFGEDALTATAVSTAVYDTLQLMTSASVSTSTAYLHSVRHSQSSSALELAALTSGIAKLLGAEPQQKKATPDESSTTRYYSSSTVKERVPPGYPVVT